MTMRYHNTIQGRFNPDNLQMMEPRYPTQHYAASHAIIKTPTPGGQYGFQIRALRGLGAGEDGTTVAPTPQPVAASDDLSGAVLLHVAGAALIGAATGAFAGHDMRAAGPGALGLAGLTALFDAGRTAMSGKVTLGIGIGLAGALGLLGGWILAKDQRGRAR
jgi:hypothetical protein